jgi:uncharacterized protein YceK
MKNLLLILSIFVLAGCSSIDQNVRPESSFFVSKTVGNDQSYMLVKKDGSLGVTCLDKEGMAVSKDTNSSQIQCLYYAVDISKVFNSFEFPSSELTETQDRTLKKKRDIYISFLVNVADQNCETFLSRSFASKSGFDAGRNTFQDILTGASAATAIGTPPVAAGLSLLNIVVGKTVDNVNSTYFFDKTFQAIGSAIYLEKSEIKAQIELNKKQDYSRYTIYDSVSDIRRYESACSIRIGVGKLQRLAQDALNNSSASKKTDQHFLSAVSEKLKATERIASVENKLKEKEKELSDLGKSIANKPAADKIQVEVAKLNAELSKEMKLVEKSTVIIAAVRLAEVAETNDRLDEIVSQATISVNEELTKPKESSIEAPAKPPTVH